MSTVTSHATRQSCSAEEWALRVDLAAAFRLAVQFNWHESVANHFSAALGDDGKTFLLNPRWRHFSTIRASDLLKLDADDPEVMNGDNPPDASAWCIHGSVHAALPDARVLIHCHPTYATALCGLKDPALLPIEQNTARFFNRVAFDLAFGGIADDAEEGRRIVDALGDRKTLIMGNHGVLTVGETVAEAFESMYFLERAAKTLVLAYSTGQPLAVMDDELAEKTAAGWNAYAGMADAHFTHLKSELDRTDPSYHE